MRSKIYWAAVNDDENLDRALLRESRDEARAVAVDPRIREATERAQERGRTQIVVEDGGSVANAYTYPASTEEVVVCALPDGRIAVWICRLPANKVTYAGVIATAVGEWARSIMDGRYGDEARTVAKKQLIALAEAQR